ncbi:phosphate ABC transporter substrate-binding protein PstS [Monashia sp. NPDC004114]
MTTATLRRALVALFVATLVTGAGSVGLVAPAYADTYKRVSGSGSTWSANALQQWIANVRQYGMTVDYSDTGSSVGRQQFANGTVDFAVSEIPYGVPDGASQDPIPPRKFAYMPIVAGGTSFMYNLTVGGRRLTALRLSGNSVAKIFTGAITRWNDPQIASENPGLRLPAKRIVPVVRSDGSGTSAQFTAWMVAQQGSVYGVFCRKVGKSPCTQTSNYPVPPGGGFQSKSGSNGVAGFVRQAQNDGAITYVEYSYAKNAGFPVVKVLNRAGYYTLPTAENVAVGLLGAQIETRNTNPSVYLTQKLAGVYNNADPRAYPLSSYSYMILPTAVEANFTTDKGKTLGDFAYYFLCAGQQQADVLGYSPLPINLVKAGLAQVRRIPGVDVQRIDVSKCNNPTFSASGENTLAKTATMPQQCDKAGPLQCGTVAERSPAAGQGTNGSNGNGTNGSNGSSGNGSSGNGTNGAGTGSNGRPGATGGTGSGTGATPGTTGGTGSVGAPGPGGAVTPAVNEFGETVAAGGGSGDGAVLAQAVSQEVAARKGWRGEHTLMLIAGLALLAATLGPPLLSRRPGRK